MRTLTKIGAIVAGVGLSVMLATTAFAHEQRTVGNHKLRVGWLVEPTYAGFPNGVQLFASNADSSPVKDAKLTAVVIFGKRDGTQKTSALDLVPKDENPGEYDAALVPSRPGTYTFHITGSLASGPKVDEYFTSSDTTFDDVKEPQTDEFPAKDPNAGQLTQRLDTTDKNVSSTKSRVLIAIVIGIVALLAAVVALVRKG